MITIFHWSVISIKEKTQAFYNHSAMDVMRICGCDELIDSDSTKFDSNRQYHTCYLYKEDTTVNDLIAEVLGDIQIVDSSYTIQDTFDNWMKKVLNDVNLHNNDN